MKGILTLNIVLMLIVVSCGRAPSPAPTVLSDTATSIPPTITPSSTSEPTNTAVSTSAFRAFRSANCCKAKTIEAGEYEMPSWLGIPLTMEVGSGWSVLNEKEARLFLLAGKGQNEFKDPSQVLVFMAVPEGSPQSVLASIKDSSELSPIGEIMETTIAGFPGWQFDAMAKPNAGNKGSAANSIPAGAQNLPAINKYFAPGFLWTTWTAEPHLRFVALEVGEHVLLLEIESPPAGFEAFASETDQVLQTLKLQK